ncbi:MAG: hypothetical protein Q9194_003888 [Teloschistes cf. exilis]
MARVQKPSNYLFFALPVRRRPTCASNTFHRLTRPVSTPLRQKSSSAATPFMYDLASTASEEPRWKATPSRMATRGTPNRIFKGADQMNINKSPEKLDRILTRVIGEGGDSMLSDEVKWLAVTHKSFDHGRRGFNDRLAYLAKPTGKRIIELQASLSLIAGSTTTPEPAQLDEYGREPFKHPALTGLAGLTRDRKVMVISKTRMAQLANKYGLMQVLRWKPKKVGHKTSKALKNIKADVSVYCSSTTKIVLESK